MTPETLSDLLRLSDKLETDIQWEADFSMSPCLVWNSRGFPTCPKYCSYCYTDLEDDVDPNHYNKPCSYY